ncbi:DUF1501 domain-containing protein [Roseiconus nitratireducens]|uniref:DUF1501 domain-containing protein n=1 Tax=Roseiconus nitratireducens TaxID=2605748 RepID=A0A5M6D6P0_9BACT|nr:DUF1501 domain-containing protein [Roseiconus nitratireducens]KAA5543217.1 DUF1501 domain-containing protein [Roseiconus nitratireducens]
MTRPEISTESRREFLRHIARDCLGVSFAGAVGSGAMTSLGEAQAAEIPGGKAKHIIYLFMEGAMSHLDTFDPKTGVEEAGETKPIQTRVPGMAFGDRFPKLAYLAGAIAVVRSLSTETGAHEKGRYLMRTSYKQLNSIQHPALGAWMLSEQGRLNRELPGNYVVGSGNGHPGAGFLEPSLSPVPIANPSAGIKNIKLPKYLPEPLFERRLMLASKFDSSFQSDHRSNPKIEAYNQLYHEARNLMGSEHLKVFDIRQEPQAVRDAYGNNTLGQGCLLARRLVQSGARFVEVSYGGWDMHQDLYGRLDERAEHLDTALGILLKDLHRLGLLEETLVVLTTEFGRKPKLNANAGRDHHPGAFCSLLAGAGIRGGQVHGASDEKGFSVAEDHVSVSDFNKTIAAAAGLPLEKEQFAPNGRPFKIGGDGDAVAALLA